MARVHHSSADHTDQRFQSDQKPKILEDDDFGVLDDNILDCNSPDMSSTPDHRKGSCSDTASAYTRNESVWIPHDYEIGPVDRRSSMAQQMFAQSNQRDLPAERSHQVHYRTQVPVWQLSGHSESCTPTAPYDSFAPEYSGRVPYGNAAVHMTPATQFKSSQPFTVNMIQSNSHESVSPQSGKGWMSPESKEPVENQSISLHLHPQNTAYGTNSPPLLRRDGIRKKNARFEIPAERNLRTIDHMINQTNDEQEIKELKQQKRLLRNRQAALDSRQRKKQHTERLEEEKKTFTTIISELEEALGEMKIREAEWEREKGRWAASQQHYQQYIDTLVMEKEELVRCHTIESGELRKRNAYLVEQALRLESASMSAAPGSTEFSVDFSEFDHLTMNSSPWDNVSMVNEFHVDSGSPLQSSAVESSKKDKLPTNDDDRTATSGLLLMLLLCGAWMASKSPASSALPMPRVPEDVRAASAAVLSQLYEDAGVQPEGRPTDISRADGGDNLKHPFSPIRPVRVSFPAQISPLRSLHQQLVAPTEEQVRQDIFSLSVEQYNGLASDGTLDQHEESTPSKQRNFQRALARLRTNRGSTAESYTRSLMYDNVPRDVVKDFARMVADCNAIDPRQKGSETTY